MVTAVFRAWQQAGIPFLVLRNYERLPDFTTNDIDVLVAPEQLRDAERVARAAALETGFRLHNRAEFATLALYFSSRRSNAQVHFDLFTALKWRGFDFLSCRGFLEQRVARGGFAVPHPGHEAATNLLATMIYTGKVKEKYKRAIAEGFRGEPAVATEILSRTYGPRHARFLVEAAAAERWAEIEVRTSALRRALVMRQWTWQPGATLRSLLADVARLARRFARPPGLSVVLCGADGSGKSTVAEAIIEGLGTTFAPPKGRHFHWKPPLFSARRQAERGPVSNPHGRPARNPIVSLLYFGFHWLEFVLGSHLRIRPVAFRGGLVLLDRYYYDFLVDQRRYRLRVPRGLIRLGGWWVRQPDLVLLLDAPTEILQARKHEVPPDETERQRQAYLAMVRGLKNGAVIDAAPSAGRVAEASIRAILDFMAQRQTRREPRT